MNLRLIFILFSLFFYSSFAQTSEPPKPLECIELLFGGLKIGCLSNGVGPFSSTDRVSAITKRLSVLSDDQTFDTDRMYVLNHENNSEILAGDIVIASLRDSDLETNDDRSRATLAQAWLERMRESISRDRKLKSPKELTWAIAYTILATIGLLISLKVFSSFFPKVKTYVDEKLGNRIQAINLKGKEILSTERISSALHLLVKSTRIILTLVLLYIYVPLIFSFYPYTANWAPKLYGYIINPITTIFQIVVSYIPNLFFVLMIGIAARYTIKLVKVFFMEIEQGTIRFDGFFKDWAQPTFKLVRILIIVSAFIMAFPYLPGSKSPAFQGVSVFIGVLLSLGSSSAVANVVAGVVITYMRPFKIGDRVKISETMGDVVEKTLLVTRIRTIKNVDISIPNSMVLGSHIVNYSTIATTEGLILNTTVTIGYNAPWRKVHEALKNAAKRTELIDQKKEPFIFQTALNDFFVSYELNAYTNEANKMASIYSALHQNIQDSFNESGIEIMSPHYTSLRDGNEVTIPSDLRPKDYQAPQFQVLNRGSKDNTSSNI